MFTISFTRHLSQIAPVSPVEVSGGTLAAVFDAVFFRYPQAKGYVPDEHGRVRKAHRRVRGWPADRGSQPARHDRRGG